MSLPADWAYLTARIAAIAFMIAVFGLQVRLPRTKATLPHREVILLSAFVAMAAGSLFGEVGWEAKPWAYVWFSLLLLFLCLVVARSYQAARALSNISPSAMEPTA